MTIRLQVVFVNANIAAALSSSVVTADFVVLSITLREKLLYNNDAVRGKLQELMYSTVQYLNFVVIETFEIIMIRPIVNALHRYSTVLYSTVVSTV
jgi:hypothetical protein